MAITRDVGISAIFIIGLLIISVFLTMYVYDAKITESDDAEKKAKKYLNAAMWVGWGAFAILTLLWLTVSIYGKGAISAVDATTNATGVSNNITLSIYIIMSMIYFAIGVLLLMTAVQLKKGGNFSKNKEIYNNCIIIGSISISLLAAAIIYYSISYATRKR